MTSIINTVVKSVCIDHSNIYNKADYIGPYLPWVDLALGIIFCVVGGLAVNGLVPLSGGAWLIAAGTIELTIGMAVPCVHTFKGCFQWMRAGIHTRAQNNNNEGFYGFLDRHIRT